MSDGRDRFFASLASLVDLVEIVLILGLTYLLADHMGWLK